MIPYLNQNVGKNIQESYNFRGLNKEAAITVGELSDMTNLSSRFAPCLAPRGKREVIKTLTSGQDIASFGEKLFYIQEDGFYYNGEHKGSLTKGEKQIAVMNDYVIIFPDKIAYDSINDKFERMELSWTSTSGQLTFTDKEMIFNSGSLPKFSVGDGVVISGCADAPYNNRAVVIRAVGADRFIFDSETFEETEKENGLVKLERNVPTMTFICEHNNRLWGCDESKTIYCSKQGSHTNFNVYEGLVTDSFYTEVGTPGKFTGVCSYNSKIYFFKEDCIHAMYGYKPNNFQVIDISTQGVKEGCSRSLAVTNNLLFYVSRDGIMIFDSTVPELISKKLGYVKYDEAIGGGNRKFYYVSLRKGDKWELLVYDSDINEWYKQDNLHVKRFNYYNGDLIYLDSTGTNIVKIDSENSNEVVKWEAITGELNLVEIEKKATMRIRLKVDIPKDAELNLWLKRDNRDWELVRTFIDSSRKIIYGVINPMRCESFRMKLTGKGEVKIYSITREYTERSYQ